MANFQAMLATADQQEVLELVCEGLCQGKTLWRVAKDNRWPVRMLLQWIEGDEKRREYYNLSLRVAADGFTERVLECADSATSENYQRNRFQADAYKWLASKLDRARFGDDKQGPTVNNQITIIHESQ